MAAVAVGTQAARAVTRAAGTRSVVLHNAEATSAYYDFTEAGCTTAGGIPIAQGEQVQIALPGGAEVWVIAGSATTLRVTEIGV